METAASGGLLFACVRTESRNRELGGPAVRSARLSLALFYLL